MRLWIIYSILLIHRVGAIKREAVEIGADVEVEVDGGVKKDNLSEVIKAGADTVVIASKEKIVMVKDENMAGLERIGKYFDDVDLVITEGFKKENRPKIEIYRSHKNKPPICQNDKTVIALVTDTDIRVDVPVFGLEEIKSLADLIEKKYL